MSKDSFYFSHDYNSRNDPKIKKLLAKHGFLGYGIFWAIIEDLYNNANALPTDYETIAHDLRSDEKTIQSIVTDFDLFVISGDIFGSSSVENRLKSRDEKSVKARESAIKRWNKNANALRTECAPNAIKERKGNKRKGNNKILLFTFQSLEFMETWEKLIRSPKWKKKTDDALQASLDILAKETEQDAIAMMKNSIAGNWQGVFPLKENKKPEGSKTDQMISAYQASRKLLGLE